MKKLRLRVEPVDCDVVCTVEDNELGEIIERYYSEEEMFVCKLDKKATIQYLHEQLTEARLIARRGANGQ